jgi:hypothetical protein
MRRSPRPALIALVVLAALAATALAAAAPASASTVLCNHAYTFCPESNTYASGTAIKAASSSVKIATNLGNVECSESSLEGKTTGASAAELTAWTLGKCVLGKGSCTATTELLPYSGSFVGENGNGSLTISGNGGEAGWKVTCGGLINCKLRFNPALAATGGNPAQLAASEKTMTRTGGICPSYAKFTATYTVTAPQPVYLERPQSEEPPPPTGTVFCKANELPCSAGNQYPKGTAFSAALAPGTKVQISTDLGNWECEASTFSGETTGLAGKPLPATVGSISFGSCLLGGSGCTVAYEGLPYSASFTYTEGSAGNGAFDISNVQYILSCGSIVRNCTLKAEDDHFTVTGGGPAVLETNQEFKPLHGEKCPGHLTFKAKYQLSSPSPLYLSEI